MIGILNNYVSVNHHSLKGYVLVRTFQFFYIRLVTLITKTTSKQIPFPLAPQEKTTIQTIHNGTTVGL